ncbi:MAG: PKD domain-containing protein [Rubrivivax sp.]|nr:MAG: PKD domain-containing protein [Rubrivivax sp.]
MQKVTLRLRALGMGVLASTVLAACGGGGGSSAPPAPTQNVTAIPENLAITAPASADSATAVKFGSSAGSLAGIKYQWNFGDGDTSTEAAPSHSYANGGEFDVVLKVTNEAGSSKETRFTVSITNMANVRGLECTGAGNTGWCWQSPRPMGNEVTAVRFIDALTGWRGGGAGDIFNTKDGGKTWHRQRIASSAAIKNFLFHDRLSGLVYTFEGELFRTADGGATWARCDISGVKDVGLTRDGVAFASAVDASYRSEDGGLTWSKVAMTVRARSSGSVFWNAEDGVLYRSQDGGKSAHAVLRISNTSESLIQSDWIVPVTEQHLVYIVAKRVYPPNHALPVYVAHVYTTNDGGQSWSMTEATGLPERPDRMLAFGAMSDGRVLTARNGQPWLSVDGGKTWTAPVPPNELAGTDHLEHDGRQLDCQFRGSSGLSDRRPRAVMAKAATA